MPRDPVELTLVNFLRGSGMNIASCAERVAGL